MRPNVPKYRKKNYTNKYHQETTSSIQNLHFDYFPDTEKRKKATIQV